MLIIAQPKSASTSFSVTLTKIANKELSLMIKSTKNEIKCYGYEELSKCHCNMKEKSPALLDKMICDRETVYRDHLLPTYNHAQYLKLINKPVVILLRNPDHSYDCYLRMFEKNKNALINRELIRQQLLKFYYLWKGINLTVALKINYEDLILNYEETMRTVMNHFEITGDIMPLEKLKYTGIGESRLTC